MAREKHQKHSEELFDKNGEDIRIYEADRSEGTNDTHDRLSSYFSKQNDEPEDTQTRSNIQMNLSRGQSKAGDNSQSPQHQERLNSEERSAQDHAPQRSQSGEEQAHQDTPQNRMTTQSFDERQQEEPLSSGRATESVDVRSPQTNNSDSSNNTGQEQTSQQEPLTPQSDAANAQVDDVRVAALRELEENKGVEKAAVEEEAAAQEIEEKPAAEAAETQEAAEQAAAEEAAAQEAAEQAAAEEAAAQEAAEQAAAEEAAAQEAAEQAAAEEAAAQEAAEQAAAEEAAAQEAAEQAAAEEAAAQEAAEQSAAEKAEAGFGTTDVEDAEFSGSWGQIDEGINGWYTDNDGGKIEVGKETTYGGSDSSNVVIEIEADSGDQSNLYKDFDTSPGQVIEINFDYSARSGSGGDDSAIEVYWDGELIDTIVPGYNFGWENYNYEVTADGDSARLEFQATDSNSLGGLLDNIKVDIIDGTEEAVAEVDVPNLTITGSDGAEDLIGGAGDDTLVYNADSEWSGYSAHNVETGDRASLAGHNRSSDVFKGGDGHDTLEGTSGDDAIFLDDGVSGFASDKQARIQDIEEINVGDGDDIVDMTSSRYDYDEGIIVNGGDGDDTLWTSTGDDTIIGGQGNDEIYAGDGSDTLEFMANMGNDVVDGGSGDGWTDTIELQGFEGHSSENGWQLQLDQGSVLSTNEANGEMLLSQDSAGSVTFEDGGSITFENIEQITW